MTVASREYAESGWKEECLQSLAERLRDEADYKSMLEPDSREAEKRRLIVQAADWCNARGVAYNWNELGKVADNAIGRYIENWKNKKSGEDDRSHAFGEMLMKKDTSNALQT